MVSMRRIQSTTKRIQSTMASASSVAGMVWKPPPAEKAYSEKDQLIFRMTQPTADPSVDEIYTPSITSICSGSRTERDSHRRRNSDSSSKSQKQYTSVNDIVEDSTPKGHRRMLKQMAADVVQVCDGRDYDSLIGEAKALLPKESSSRRRRHRNLSDATASTVDTCAESEKGSACLFVFFPTSSRTDDADTDFPKPSQSTSNKTGQHVYDFSKLAGTSDQEQPLPKSHDDIDASWPNESVTLRRIHKTTQQPTISITSGTSSGDGLECAPPSSEKASSEKDQHIIGTIRRTQPTDAAGFGGARIGNPLETTVFSGFNKSTQLQNHTLRRPRPFQDPSGQVDETARQIIASARSIQSMPSSEADSITSVQLDMTIQQTMDSIRKIQSAPSIASDALKFLEARYSPPCGGDDANHHRATRRCSNSASKLKDSLLQNHTLTGKKSSQPTRHRLFQLALSTQLRNRLPSHNMLSQSFTCCASQSMLSLESSWEGDEAEAKHDNYACPSRKVTTRPNHKPMHRCRPSNETLTSSMRTARYSVDNLAGSSKSVQSMASLRNQPWRENKSTASVELWHSGSSEPPPQQDMNDGVCLNNTEWGVLTGPVNGAPLLEQKAGWVPSGVNFDDHMEVHVFA